MNEELHTRLIKYLDYLEEVGKKGAEFVQDQAPETVRQFLLWEFCSDLFVAAIAASVCIFFAIVARKFIKKLCSLSAVDRCGDVGFGWWAGSFIFSVITVVCFGIATNNVYTAMKVRIAPNVFLIEKAADLVKKSRNTR